jgi:hypothetical protein
MIQSILIPTEYYTYTQALNWLIKHNYYDTSMKVDITSNYYRFRQHNPTNYAKYRTIELKDKVKLILEY